MKEENKAPRGLTFKGCLKLCVPGLLLGMVLRISVILATPEAYYGADSNSYFYTAYQLHDSGKLTLPSKRRYIYPVLLIGAPLLPGNTAQVVALGQHFLGLVIIVGVGWVVGNAVRRPTLGVPLVTCITAVWPRLLWYEHEMIAEALLTAMVVASFALVFPLGSLRAPRRLFWFLVCIGLIIAVKPHGKPLWAALLVFAACTAGSPLKWPRRNWAAVAASVLVLLTAGSSSERAWLFLNTNLPLIKTEGEPWGEYRAILKPAIEETRADLANYAFRQKYKKKLNSRNPADTFGPAWAALMNDQDKYSKVAKRLAFEGMLRHPFDYAYIVLTRVALVVAEGQHCGKLDPKDFWKEQEDNNDERWEKRPSELELLYEKKQPEYRQLVAERSQRSLWFYPYIERIVPWYAWTVAEGGEPGGFPCIRFKPLGWLIAFGAAIALIRGRIGAVLVLPVALYLLAVYGIGDAVTRYLLPVEWIGFVLAAIGLDWAIALLTGLPKELRTKEKCAAAVPR